MYIYLAPLNILLSIVVLTDIIQMLIWTYTGFAFKIDFEQKEIILNHSLLFYKKKISFEHILKIGVEKKKSFIVVDQAVLLNKWQKYLSKGNKGTYKIRLTAIPSHYFELLQTIFNLQQHDNLFYE
jgi:hypothetical protein